MDEPWTCSARRSWICSASRGMSSCELKLGTQGFGYRDWVGPFYPDGTTSADFLSFYSQVFDTVELDTTFYGPPRPAIVRDWRDSVSEGFVFSAKMPKAITHEKRLVGAEPDLVEFLTAMLELGSKLGPILVQLPPTFSHDEVDTFIRFARILPEEFRYAVEFRHPSWLTPESASILSEHRLAWANIDLFGMPRDVRVTSDFSYVRWLGRRSDVRRLNRVVIDRSDDFDHWSQELDRISARLQRIYGYVNNHYAGHSPASVNEIRSRMRLAVVEPQSLWRQQTLDV